MVRFGTPFYLKGLYSQEASVGVPYSFGGIRGIVLLVAHYHFNNFTVLENYIKWMIILIKARFEDKSCYPTKRVGWKIATATLLIR